MPITATLPAASAATGALTVYDYDSEWTAAQLIQKINNDKISWLIISTFQYQLQHEDVRQRNNFLHLTNNGSNANYFLLYSQGCYSGSFDNCKTDGTYSTSDCIGEKLATLPNGPVAYIGNSRYGLGSPYNTDGSGQRFHRYFHHALFAKKFTPWRR